jgi:hypothetical protein
MRECKMLETDNMDCLILVFFHIVTRAFISLWEKYESPIFCCVLSIYFLYTLTYISGKFYNVD